MCQVLGTYASGRFTEDTAGEPLMKVIWGKQASTSSSQTGGGKASKPMLTRIDLCNSGVASAEEGETAVPAGAAKSPLSTPDTYQTQKTQNKGWGGGKRNRKPTLDLRWQLQKGYWRLGCCKQRWVQEWKITLTKVQVKMHWRSRKVTEDLATSNQLDGN